MRALTCATGDPCRRALASIGARRLYPRLPYGFGPVVARAQFSADDGVMKNHSSRTWVVYALCLLVLGIVAWWVVSALLSMLFKLFVVALVVGGVVYLYRRSTRRIRNPGPRQLRR
jgi:Flp pilus assembly protein TadB